MNCPTCNGDTIVLHKHGGDRRRKCIGQCGLRFTTTEVLKEDHERLQAAVDEVRQVAERLKPAA